MGGLVCILAMAILQQQDRTIDTGKLSDESRGTPWNEIIRDYDPEPGTVWRFGLPNYARVNKAYFENRSKKHAEGSLESVVNKLVKSWEVESHHIADAKQWKTMDVSVFTAQVNNGPKVNAQLMATRALTTC